MDNGNSLFDTILISGSALAGWLFGETGRAMTAGAAGGLIRHLMDEKFHLVRGLLAVLTGSICATYFGPAAIRFMEQNPFYPIDSAGLEGSAYFAVGILGMSSGKFVLAVFNATLRRVDSRKEG